ncbi:hypothetical protein ACMFMG_011486 [Clarireedia jacksonii]
MIAELQRLLLKSEACPDSGTEDFSSDLDSTLNLRIHTSDSQIINRDFSYYKNFSNQNPVLMCSLEEELLPLISTKLGAKDTDTSYIQNACLVGGYLGLLGRGEFQEHLETFMDGAAGGGMQPSHIEAHLIYLMLCRVAHFTEDILNANRMAENTQSQFAFAAAVILDFELRSFQSFSASETIAALQSSIQAQKLLLEWVSDVRRELQSRVCDGCRRYSPWNSVVSSSVNALRKSPKFKRRFWISASEQQNSVVLPQTNRWTYPTITTDPLSIQEYPTTSGENHASRVPELYEDVNSLHGPGSSVCTPFQTTYGLPIGYDDHYQFETTTSAPFISGNGHASNPEYEIGPSYWGFQMLSPVFNSSADQDFTLSQQSSISLSIDPISDNPLLQEPLPEGDYPTFVTLDDY